MSDDGKLVSIHDAKLGKEPSAETVCRECGRGIPLAYVRSKMVGGRYTPGAWCVHCEGDWNRDKHARLREAIQQLQDARDARAEWAAIKNLRELGHPDVDGLIASIGAKIHGPSASKRTVAPRKSDA